MKKEGSKLTIENQDGIISQCNSSFVKRFNEPTEHQNDICEDDDDNIDEMGEKDDVKEKSNDNEPRPKRTIKLPERFKDFVMS